MVTLVASYLVLSELRFPGVAGDGAAVCASTCANMRFAANATDYLGAEVAQSPFLHFWSLGVEEQFYLFWPLIIIVALRLMAIGRLGIAIGAMAIVSFWLALVWTDISAPWAFFSLPTRAWQLAVGCTHGHRRHPLAASGPHGWLCRRDRVAGLAIIALRRGDARRATRLTRHRRAASRSWAQRWSSSAERGPARCRRDCCRRSGPTLGRPHLLLAVPVALALADPRTAGVGADSLAFNLVLVVVAAILAWASTEFIEVPIRHGRFLSCRRVPASAAIAGSVVVAVGALGAAALQRPLRRCTGRSRGGASLELPEPVRVGPVPESLAPPLTGAYWDLPGWLP